MTVSGVSCQIINTSHERTTLNLFHADADITLSLDGLQVNDYIFKKHFFFYFVYFGTAQISCTIGRKLLVYQYAWLLEYIHDNLLK